MTDLYARTGKMVERKVRDEHILVPVGDNLYELDSLFTLNEVASYIWSLTEQETARPSIVERVVARYDVQPDEAKEDTCRILEELVEIGALKVHHSPG